MVNHLSAARRRLAREARCAAQAGDGDACGECSPNEGTVEYNALVIEIYKLLIASMHLQNQKPPAILAQARKHADILYPLIPKRIKREEEKQIPDHWQRYQKATGEQIPDWIN